MPNRVSKSTQVKLPNLPQNTFLILFLQFVPLFLFWLVLSGSLRPFFLISGVVACGAVVLFNRALFSPLAPTDKYERLRFGSALSTAFHAIIYIPWLISQIIKDNLLVAYLVLHPKMPINPKLIQFKTRLKKPSTQVVLANSITLSPGTITVLLENSRYTIHMLTPSSVKKLASGEAQSRVGRIFDEDPEKPPKVRWGNSFKELK